MTGTSAQSRFLDMQALATLARMRFTTKHRVEGAYSGRHVSRQKGGAGEFVDFREYSPGEDLRRLDWKIYARTGSRTFVCCRTKRICSARLPLTSAVQCCSERIPKQG